MSKTLRQFQCRDDLWARVEALAERRGISPDDVIQAALLQLFKSKKKERSAPGPAAATPRPPSGAVPAARPPSKPEAPPPPRSTTIPTPTTAPPSRPPPGPPGPPGTPTAARGVPKLPRPTSGATKNPQLPRPKTGNSTRLPPPSNRAAPAAPSQPRPLYLCYDNQWYVVDQDQFVIGRGAKYSDLPIKDANISRRHCAIVRRNSDYFIKDLGSTNGIEFNGDRVDNHKIEEGSLYYLCDHELRFSFNAPG